MELQWPLIIFTAFVAWSAGLFATQSVLALKGEAAKAQMPALIASVTILAIGGIAVFFHLEHWERIFNGFGHITSGITQELICVVIMIAVMVVYLVALRKGEGKVGKPVAIAGVASAALLVIIAGMSYLMPARPTWNNPVEILSLLGNACVLGPATMALIIAIIESDEKLTEGGLTKILFLGAVVNAICTVLYIAAMALEGGSFVDVGYYFDAAHPTHPILAAADASPFAGGATITTILAAIFSIVAAILCFLSEKNGAKGGWKTNAAITLALAVAGAITLRMTFYMTGASIFMFF